MAYDPATGNLVLFGGENASGVLSDTWPSPISPHHLRHFLSGRWGSWPTASKERSQRWRIPT